jgi:hypothetical protein
MRKFGVALLLAVVCAAGFSAFSAEVTTAKLVPVHRHHRWHRHRHHRHRHHHRRVILIRLSDFGKSPQKEIL